MKNIMEILGWVILASLAVLIIMNASSFAAVIQSASAAVTSESALLTGSGYGASGYGAQGISFPTFGTAKVKKAA